MLSSIWLLILSDEPQNTANVNSILRLLGICVVFEKASGLFGKYMTV